MTSPLDISKRFTGLDAGARDHLERLVATWSLLADLSFSDLLLYVPIDQEAAAGEGAGQGVASPRRGVHFLVLGQMRPTTSRTLFELDLVGQVVAATDLQLVARCWKEGVATSGEDRDGLSAPATSTATSVQCVPVRFRGEVLGVLCRTWSPEDGRRPGLLERVYIDVFDRFTTMIAEGMFPFVSDDAAIEEAPRVGDGVVLLDEYARVAFASPNAVSALHRMGVVSAITGASLQAMGVDTAIVERAFTTRLPVIEEIERIGDVMVMCRCIPLVAGGEVTGAMLLLRDVSDLRRRDRLLLSKDAAIREVHHRVKNNLQTISSLLRLQGRRLDSPGARAALGEAERRIRSIALVHELLSRESGDHVPFDEIVHSLIRMAKESHTGDRPLLLRVDGDAGAVATDIATPLAVVLAELLQNAVEHAFAVETEAEEGPAKLDLVFRHDTEHLEVEVRDNGRGLPPGFDVDESASLGLAIVRDLVRTQLAGAIAFTSDKGTIVRLTVPLRHRAGRRA